MLSTADGSHETESTDSLVLPSQRPRQRSESPVPTRPRTFSLRFVFKRWVMFGGSIILFWFMLSTSRWVIIKRDLWQVLVGWLTSIIIHIHMRMFGVTVR